jgi:hypothetical protein
MDAHPKVVQLAQSLPETTWKPLERLVRYEIATEPRRKPQRIKEAIVRFKGYLNKKLVGESVAEFSYQPNKCRRSYRLVVVRENISTCAPQREARLRCSVSRLLAPTPSRAVYCASCRRAYSIVRRVLPTPAGP